MMQRIVYTIKQAYSGYRVNVVTWDAGLNLDAMECCGLAEFGTAQSKDGLEYCFVVFLGSGEVKWTGKIWLPFRSLAENKIFLLGFFVV